MGNTNIETPLDCAQRPSEPPYQRKQVALMHVVDRIAIVALPALWLALVGAFGKPAQECAVLVLVLAVVVAATTNGTGGA